MALDPVTAGIGLVSTIIDKVFPNKEAADAAKLEMLKLQQNGELSKFMEASGIIKTEAASEHWLAACWRPITMLTFAALIVARWFGWAAPDLAEAEYLKLWDIVEFGLGGYVIGRSVEKSLPSLAQVLKK